MHWMLLVRLLCNYLVRPSHEIATATISWRGSKLTQAQASVLRVGIVIRPPMFVATSLDHATAVHMADGPLVRFEIPVGCRNAYPAWTTSPSLTSTRSCCRRTRRFESQRSVLAVGGFERSACSC